MFTTASNSRSSVWGSSRRFAAWATNHNFFNKRWMERDSYGCSGEGHEALFEREGGDLFDVREAVLGHVQQGGNPSPFDRIQATRLA